MTQPAQTTEVSDSILDETSGVEVRHSFIRPKQHTAPGSDSVPAFLIRQSEDQFVLPRLLVWTTLGLMAYGSLEASSWTYHFLRDARVKPLAAAHIRAEVHALVEEVARRQPSARTARAGFDVDNTMDEAPAEAHAATVAFVPYSHVPNIKANAMLYECRVFSMFACEPVGRVVELLPGEVELSPAHVEKAEATGSPERGVYAVMQLTDPRAAEAESLRVRDALDSLLLESSQSPALEGETLL